LLFGAFLTAAGLVLSGGLASAQQAFNNCSISIGITATPIVFPAAGSTGPAAPTTYLEICNSGTTNALGINYVGGTAALLSPGTVRIVAATSYPCIRWERGQIPVSISVIGAGSPTPVSCAYR
jgi:hypothetical protein